MADYHVGLGLTGIYAGTLNKPRKDGIQLWRDKSDVTDEAIAVVRDYMAQELLGGLACTKGTTGGYEWDTKDGRKVELRVTISDRQEAEIAGEVTP